MINLSEKPTIGGEKVVLRPFKSSDLPFIEECLKDSEVIKLTGSTSDFDKEVFTDWYNTRNEQVDRLDLAIVDKSSNIVVGEVVVNEYEEENNSMNFRILIGPKGRNRGLGTEATQLMISYIFQHTNLKQVTLNVFDFNPRAKRVYEKIGFIVETIDKNEIEWEGDWINSINMVLSRERWQESK